jgi:CheY-like chemotaxis protein
MEKNIKILVVDNEPESLDLISSILLKSKADYNILIANNGQSAIEIAKKESPDLIVSDWVMPQMDGLQLIRQIQKLNFENPIPIIICTGANLSTENLKKALDTGAVDFLRKPIEPLELLARVKSILRFSETYQNLINERKKNAKIEKQYLENLIEKQTEELKSKAIAISRFNHLLNSVNHDLKALAKNVNNERSEINIAEVVTKIDKSMKNDNWKDFQVSFEKHYPKFFTHLLEINHELSSKDLKLAALLKINSNTKAISGITQQSVRSLEMARFRLRKKLNIPKEESFEAFFKQIDC